MAVLLTTCCTPHNTGAARGGEGGSAGAALSGCSMEGDDDIDASFTAEGSSVVFVNTNDAMQDDGAEDAAGCFTLFAAKVCAVV